MASSPTREKKKEKKLKEHIDGYLFLKIHEIICFPSPCPTTFRPSQDDLD